MSTESGIPDYRGPNGTLYAGKPMNYQELDGSAAAAPNRPSAVG